MISRSKKNLLNPEINLLSNSNPLSMGLSPGFHQKYTLILKWFAEFDFIFAQQN